MKTMGANFAANFQIVCSSCAFAAAATVFYKKDFSEQRLPILGCLSLLGLLAENLDKQPAFLGVCCLLTSFLLIHVSYLNRDWLTKAAKIDFFLPMLAAVLEARFGLVHLIGIDIPYWASIRIFAVAVPQFLRKPLWLKTKLQDVRSKLGPMFVMFVTTYAMSLDSSNVTFLTRYVARIAAGAAIIAGVFFRPDNSTVLNILAYLMNVPYRPGFVPYKTNLIQRRNVHRQLMLTSFMCCATLFAKQVWSH